MLLFLRGFVALVVDHRAVNSEIARTLYCYSSVFFICLLIAYHAVTDLQFLYGLYVPISHCWHVVRQSRNILP